MLANKNKKKHFSVSISSGSAERERGDRAMSVLVNRGDGTSSVSSCQSGSWEGRGRGLIPMKPLHWLRTTKWLGV